MDLSALLACQVDAEILVKDLRRSISRRGGSKPQQQAAPAGQLPPAGEKQGWRWPQLPNPFRQDQQRNAAPLPGRVAVEAAGSKPCGAQAQSSGWRLPWARQDLGTQMAAAAAPASGG